MNIPVPVTVLTDLDKRIQVIKYQHENLIHQLALETMIKSEKNERLVDFMISRLNPFHGYETILKYACGNYSIELARTAFNQLVLLRAMNAQIAQDAYEEVKNRAQHLIIRYAAATALAEVRLHNEVTVVEAEFHNVIPFARRI